MKSGEFLIPQDKPYDIFTVADLSEEQKIIKETVKGFVQSKLLTREATEKIESKDFDFTMSILEELGKLGFLGIDIPAKYGGSKLDKITSCIVTQEIGKQGSFACSFGAHAGIGSWPIIFFGNEQQRQKYLPRFASGELISCYSLTEAGSGSDAGSAKTKAVLSPDGQHFILNGEKIFVTNGEFSNVLILFAQVPGAGLSAFIVEKSFEGVSVGKEESKMGIHGSSTATIILDNAVVPVENLLGEPGQGLKIALNVLNLGRFKLAAGCLGAAQISLAGALDYARQRKQFGKAIIEFDLIREKLARMAAKVFAMEAVTYRTAQLLEESINKADPNNPKEILKAIEEYAVECSIVKVFCSEALGQIVDQEVQILGGYGYCEEYPAARHYRDARINRIFEGTNEINRLVILQMLIKKAMAGKLDFLPLVKKIQSEIANPVLTAEDGGLVQQFLFQLNSTKKMTLLAIGANLQKYNLTLEKHQIVVGLISDSLIDLFVLDSALAAFAKTSTVSSHAYTKLLFADMLSILLTRVENLFACCMEGDDLKRALSMARKNIKITPPNFETLIDGIIQNLE